MNMMTEIAFYKTMKDRLQAEFGDIDEQTLLDTLEGCTNFNEAVAAMMEQSENDTMMANALKERIREMSERKSRFEARSAAVRREIQRGMEETGQKKIELPEYTLSLRNVAPSVMITDEDALPDEFCTTIRKPDKKSIKAALEDGELPGAMLSNGGMTLSVRKT